MGKKKDKKKEKSEFPWLEVAGAILWQKHRDDKKNPEDRTNIVQYVKKKYF